MVVQGGMSPTQCGTDGVVNGDVFGTTVGRHGTMGMTGSLDASRAPQLEQVARAGVSPSQPVGR